MELPDFAGHLFTGEDRCHLLIVIEVVDALSINSDARWLIVAIGWCCRRREAGVLVCDCQDGDAVLMPWPRQIRCAVALVSKIAVCIDNIRPAPKGPLFECYVLSGLVSYPILAKNRGCSHDSCEGNDSSFQNQFRYMLRCRFIEKPTDLHLAQYGFVPNTWSSEVFEASKSRRLYMSIPSVLAPFFTKSILRASSMRSRWD